ncbi:hypothetical protein KAR91_26035 [Candidatus Pacearchaeota archaeon]|nr:hypothetical protein [Candidatus Pacearchaeota archaeon]
MAKKKIKAKKKIGRRTLYRSGFCDLASRACMLGATNEELGKLFGVTTTTIDNWIKTKPAFIGAIKKGRQVADETVAISLYKRATGYSHPEIHVSNYKGEITLTPLTKHYAPDTGAAAMWLKNRRPDKWRDKPLESDGAAEPQPVKIIFKGEDASKVKAK